ncbi:hypothetical protein PG984_015904 [Apiospora sp. TS-2023a]
MDYRLSDQRPGIEASPVGDSPASTGTESALGYERRGQTNTPSSYTRGHSYTGNGHEINLNPPSVSQPEPEDVVESSEYTTCRMAASEHATPQIGDACVPQERLWTPLVLRPMSLFGIMIIFTLCAMGLVALFVISKRMHGLVAVTADHQPLWKFGPTAVLTACLALWAQVEFRTLMLMPWKVLITTGGDANTTVLLDYRSPWSLESLWMSLKFRHWPVSAAILGTLILQLSIVLSTGLLDLKYVDLEGPSVQMLVEKRFNQSQLNNYSIPRTDDAATPYDTFRGIVGSNLDYPLGTTPYHAYLPFNLTDGNVNSNASSVFLKAQVDVWSASLSCSTILSQWEDDASHLQGNWSKTINGTELTFTHVPENEYYQGSYNLNLRNPECSTNMGFPGTSDIFQRSGFYTWLTDCQGHDGVRFITSEDIRQPVDTLRHALLLASDVYGGKSTLTVTTCVPQAAYKLAQVQQPYNQVGKPAEVTIIQDYDTPTDLAWSVFTAFLKRLQLQLILYDQYQDWELPATNVSSSSDWSDPFLLGNSCDFFIFLNISTPNSMIDWTNPTVLESAIDRFYPAFVAQIVNTDFLTQYSQDITGSIVQNSPRLMVQTLTFALMTACMIAMSGLTMFLMIRAPGGVTPCDTSPLCGVIAILAENSHILDYFICKNPINIAREIRRQHARYIVHAGSDGAGGNFFFLSRDEHEDTDSSATIQVMKQAPPRGIRAPANGQPPSQEDDRVLDNSRGWWRTWGTTPASKITTTLLLAIAIGIVQMLFSYSEEHRHISIVRVGDWVQLSWTYLPGLTVVLLATLVETCNNSLRAAHPFILLRKGHASAEDVFFSELFGKVALHRLINAIRRGQTAIALISLSSLLTPFCTIAVSGIFSQERSQISVDVSGLTRLDGSQMGVNMVAQETWQRVIDMWPLVLDGTYHFPWTSEGYAMPHVSLPGSETFTSNKSSLQIQLDVLAPEVNCTWLPRSAIAAGSIPRDEKRLWITVNVTYPESLERSCSRDILDYMAQRRYAASYSKEDVDMPFYLGASEMPMTEVIGGTQNCPFLFITLGYIPTLGYPFPAAHISHTVCELQYSTKRVDVDFSLPGFIVKSTRLSAPKDNNNGNMSQVRPVPSDFWYPILKTNWNPSDSLNQILADKPQFSYGADFEPSHTIFDTFFRFLTRPKPNNILNPESFSVGFRDSTLNAVIKIYERLLIHTASIAMHFAPEENAPRLQANVTDSPQMRVVQKRVPTRIIQGLLGTILLCNMAVFFVLDRDSDRLLPFPPTSIAAVANLVARARMIAPNPGGSHASSLVPPGSQWLSEEDMKNAGVFEVGGGFSLRTWASSRPGQNTMGYAKKWFGIDAEMFDDGHDDDNEHANEPIETSTTGRGMPPVTPQEMA